MINNNLIELTNKEAEHTESKFMELFYDDIESLFQSAFSKQTGHRDTVELTESERFAICVLSGVEIVSHYRYDCCKEGCPRSNEGAFHFETYYPCNVIWDGEKFQVVVQISKKFRDVESHY